MHVDQLSWVSAMRATARLSVATTITTAVASASISKPNATATFALAASSATSRNGDFYAVH